MAQTERLLELDPDKVTRSSVATICEEDIEVPDNRRTEKRKIGFS